MHCGDETSSAILKALEGKAEVITCAANGILRGSERIMELCDSSDKVESSQPEAKSRLYKACGPTQNQTIQFSCSTARAR